MTDTPTRGILGRIYNLCRLGYDQIASEVALNYLEHELSAGSFETVNALLAEASAEQLSPAVLLIILGITVHGKDQLPLRPRFLEITEQKLTQELGQVRALKLLEMRR